MVELKTKFLFPPESLNEWRRLDEAGRRLWLTCASRRFFEADTRFVPMKVPGRVVVVHGSLVDTLLGFYCAIGEAVNGPGGYFGASMRAFDDCLFTGFGLEYPYTILWKDSQRSKGVLDARALLKFLEDECSHDRASERFEEGRAWREEARRAALAGERTMFDEIVATIRSVPKRGGGSVTLVVE
jgi:hypothetical protein